MAGRAPVDAAALNAGVGRAAPSRHDLEDELRSSTERQSTVHLAKLVLRDISPAARGGCCHLVDRLDDARLVPGRLQRVEVVLQSFAEALQEELKDSGITLTSLMPGPTGTEFFQRADMEDTKVGRSSKDDPPRWPSRASRR